MNLLKKYRLARVALLLCATSLPLATAYSQVRSEQNPAAAPAGFDQAFPPIPESISRSSRLVLESLRSADPTTPIDIARALGAALDIEQYEHAKYFIGKLAGLNLDESALYQLNDQVGSELFLRMHGQPELQPQGAELARKVFAASKVQASDPTRLNDLIGKLSDPNNQVRSQAFRDLKRTGPVAVAAMLDVFGDYDRKDEFVSIRNALRSMDEVGIGPMLGAVSAGPMQVRYEALTALARIKTPEAQDAAIAAYFAPQTPPVLREAIALGLEKTYGQLPTEDEALQQVATRAKEFLKGQRRPGDDIRLDSVSPYVLVWRWNAESRTLESRQVAPETASRLIAFDRAADLHRWRPENPEFRQFYLMTYLDAEKRMVGPAQVLAAGSLKQAFPDLSATEVDQAIALAISQEMLPAATGGCEALGELATTEWLAGSRQANSGLMRALQSGDRHLQFAAFRTIVELDPQRAYVGNSYVLSLAVYLAGYGSRPSGLVVHPHIEVAQNQAMSMSPAGVDGRAVNNGRDLLREATSDANVRYLFVSEDLPRPGYIELIQQLRSDWRTKRMPIAILTTADNATSAQRIADRDPRTIVIPLTTNIKLIALQVDRLREIEGPWRLSNEQAQYHSEYAIDWLKKVTADRTTYRYYEVSSHFEALQNLILNPARTQAAMEILGNIGTPQAQRRLVDYASQSGAPLELRQLAVASFERAVVTRGLLLTTDEIRLQYERYKASSDQPGESQRIMGSLLDLLERRIKANGTR
jgi:CheY-like chemotaxis protein